MRNKEVVRLLFELSRPGRRAVRWPACDVPECEPPPEAVRDKPLPLPELSELDVVRHYTSLATFNLAVDTHFYPLGSCTMKYNPKRNEKLANLPGLTDLHPYQPQASVQGMLRLLYELQQFLAEISGLPAVSLQPAAGAHGELTALLIAAAYFRKLGEPRCKVLIPDSAHGTNPASAKMAGFEPVEVRSNPQGRIDLEDLAVKLDDKVAVLMITNPNTLGLFETHIVDITRKVHECGGLIYLDGANMNAVLGYVRPGDCGVDMMHFNSHKTFSSPHGGGGPGAGPICVAEKLAPYLPVPVIGRRGEEYFLDDQRPDSIGRVRSFFGNVAVLVRAWCYLRTLGPDGLRGVAQHAVLNANYLLTKLKPILDVPYGERCMHEFVVSAARVKRERGISALDIAKRLIDYGFHPPTVYFPLTVKEALMIEPTESESRETLDAFAQALAKIVAEDPQVLQQAPTTTPVRRPDEVTAARHPVLKWTP